MGIFQRVSDILTANMNDLVDRFEDPEKMLKLAIREMEDSVQRTNEHAVNVITTEKLLAKQISQYQQQIENWQSRARMFLSCEDETKAREALTRKAEIERLLPALEDQRKAAADQGSKLKRQVVALNVKVTEAKRRLDSISCQKEIINTSRSLYSFNNGSVAMHRYQKLSDSLDRAEAEMAAKQEWDQSVYAVDLFIEDEYEVEIEADLLRLKDEIQSDDTPT